ncbi:MAG: DUF6438 domain-containing protein [Bacteroidota bacterium]|nr:DUF6438 domain-containing protein [Bacteroidota bacterium]
MRIGLNSVRNLNVIGFIFILFNIQAQQIEDLTVDKEVMIFLKKNFKELQNFQLGLYTPEEDNQVYLDSIEYSPWLVADFNNDGLDDLFVAGRIKKEPVCYLIIDRIDDGKSEELVDGDEFVDDVAKEDESVDAETLESKNDSNAEQENIKVGKKEKKKKLKESEKENTIDDDEFVDDDTDKPEDNEEAEEEMSETDKLVAEIRQKENEKREKKLKEDNKKLQKESEKIEKERRKAAEKEQKEKQKTKQDEQKYLDGLFGKEGSETNYKKRSPSDSKAPFSLFPVIPKRIQADFHIPQIEETRSNQLIVYKQFTTEQKTIVKKGVPVKEPKYFSDYYKMGFVRKDTFVFHLDNIVEYNPKPKVSSIKFVQIHHYCQHGACPDYKVKVDSSGVMILQNIKNTEKETGYYKARCPKETVKEIFDLIKYLKLSSNDQTFGESSADEMLTLFVEMNEGKPIKIVDYSLAGTYGLESLYDKILKLYSEVEWIKF